MGEIFWKGCLIIFKFKWIEKKTRLLTIIQICFFSVFFLLQGIAYFADAIYSFEFVSAQIGDTRSEAQVDAELEAQKAREIRLKRKEAELQQQREENEKRLARLKASDEMKARIANAELRRYEMLEDTPRKVKIVKRRTFVKQDKFKIRCYVSPCIPWF